MKTLKLLLALLLLFPTTIWAQGKQANLFKLLVPQQRNPPSPSERTLQDLVNRCDPDGIKYYLTKGADVNKETQQGSLLYLAVRSHNSADTNQRSRCTQTVKILLEAKANPNYIFNNKASTLPEIRSVMHEVANDPYGQEIMGLLLQFGGTPNLELPGSRQTPLMVLAMSDLGSDATDQKYFRDFASRTNVNQQDAEGKTALMYAAMTNRSVVITALLGLGANQNLKDRQGKTALDYAMQRSAANAAAALRAIAPNANTGSQTSSPTSAAASDLKVDQDRFTGKTTIKLAPEVLVDRSDRILVMFLSAEAEKGKKPTGGLGDLRNENNSITIQMQAEVKGKDGAGRVNNALEVLNNATLDLLIDGRPFKCSYSGCVLRHVGVLTNNDGFVGRVLGKGFMGTAAEVSFAGTAMPAFVQTLKNAQTIEMRIAPYFELTASPSLVAKMRAFAAAVEQAWGGDTATPPSAENKVNTGSVKAAPAAATQPGKAPARNSQKAGTIAKLPVASQKAQPTDRQLTVTAAPNSERRFALIIGNGSYTSAPLPNPPNDAKALAATLTQLGFEVNNKVNVSQRDMKLAVRDFGEKLSQGGVGLFYYAGHGIQVKGRNYLVPVDAAIQREADVEIECLDMDAILSQMERSNGTNIVILDACRNNPFARSWRSASQGLAQVNAPAGTFIAYATAPGSVASDGTGQNGLYTEELLKAVREPNTSIEEVFKKVRVQVKARSKGLQVPWDASSLEGAFYFMPGKNGAPPATVAGGSAANNFVANNPPANAGGNPVTPPPPVVTAPARGLDVIERNFSSGLYDDVIRDAQALIASTPNDPKVNRLLGASLFEKGQFQQGATYLQQAILLGDSVTLKVQRHRQFLLEEKLESGTIKISKTGLELQFGNETFKVPMSGIQKLVAERGGLASVSRLNLKAKGTEGGGGKEKEKTFNFYSLAARIQQVPKGNATQGQVHCNEMECQAWAAEVTRIINAIPR